MDTNLHAGIYEVRDFKEDDRKFIKATFLKGLYFGDSWYSLIPNQIFVENYTKVADALLNNPNTIVKVACLKDDSDVILGYSILGNKFLTIHWVFVKSAWRKGGIARSLVPQRPDTVTHLTALGRSLMFKLPTSVYNPFKF